MCAISWRSCGASARAAERGAKTTPRSSCAFNATITVEKPFWTKTVPGESDGRITADYTSLDTLGLKGTEVLRLIKLGVADIASGPVSYMAADFKLYDGLDLAGLFLDIDTMRAAFEAYLEDSTFLLAPGEGTRRVYVLLRDAAGNVSMEFTDDVEEAGRRHAGGYAFTIGAMGPTDRNFYNQAFTRQGFGDDVEAIQRLWLDGRREEAAARVPIELGLHTNLLGTPAMERLGMEMDDSDNPAMDADVVAREGLENLDNGPTWFAGETNRASAAAIAGLSRREATEMLSAVGDSVLGDA